MNLFGRYGAAIDLGATNVRVALGHRDGRVFAKKSEPTNTVAGPEAISHQIADMIRSLQNESGLTLDDLQGIGIGSIGPLDIKMGGIAKPANIPHYGFVPLVEPLTSEFNVTVNLMNDCAAGVVGEKYFGLGTQEENLVYVTISTGIGGGVYVDGHLLSGKDGNAHEIGHMVIDSQGRLVCGCGKKGHWEAYCSGRNLPRYANMLLEEEGGRSFSESLLYAYTGGDQSKMTAKDIYQAAKNGDETSLMIVREVGRLNAIGVANVVNVYDPALLTLGGAVTLRNPELILKPIWRHLDEYAINKAPKIALTSLGEDVVLYGALAAAFNLPN